MKVLKNNKNDSYLALITAIQEQVKIIKNEVKKTSILEPNSLVKSQKNAS